MYRCMSCKLSEYGESNVLRIESSEGGWEDRKQVDSNNRLCSYNRLTWQGPSPSHYLALTLPTVSLTVQWLVEGLWACGETQSASQYSARPLRDNGSNSPTNWFFFSFISSFIHSNFFKFPIRLRSTSYKERRTFFSVEIHFIHITRDHIYILYY